MTLDSGQDDRRTTGFPLATAPSTTRSWGDRQGNSVARTADGAISTAPAMAGPSPEVCGPVAAEPDVAEPNVAEPNVVEPNFVEPDVAEPNVVEPDFGGASDRERPEPADCLGDASAARAMLQLYERAMGAANCGIVIADLNQRDRPLIYCNPAFEAMTGYSRAEILGRNCRFLQGPDTDPVAVDRLRRAIREGRECQATLRNYRKDGTPFWNELSIAPVRDDRGRLTHYIGVQTDVTGRREAERQRRRQLRGERALGLVTQRIRQSLNLQAVLDAAVGEVRQLLRVDRALVYRFEADWSGTVCAESVADGYQKSRGRNIQDTCFRETHAADYRQGRICAIPDIEAADLSPCHRNLLRQFQVRANLVLPIAQGDRLWGLLVVHHCQGPRPWEPLEIQLLERISLQLAIAVQQAELYEQSQAEIRRRRQVEAALQTSKARVEAQAQQLGRALNDLKWHQAQLVQSEKLSSLGQMVAGVAHEINNPVAFIYGNLKHAEDYARDTLELLEAYQRWCPDPPPELRAALDRADLDYLKLDWPKLLDSMKGGAERIRNIVQSLREFSHLQGADLKPVALDRALDSVVAVLDARLAATARRPAIQVVRQYAPLPPVPCWPRPLNQALKSLLDNACDALDAAAEAEGWGRGDWPAVTLTLERQDAWAIVRVADNGPGIPEAIRAKIFDPFFTTKPVGRGTGLGLSMAYQTAVQQHGGRLDFAPREGGGAIFSLALPLAGPPGGAAPADSGAAVEGERALSGAMVG